MYVTGTEKTKMKNEKNSISQRFMQNANWSFSGKKVLCMTCSFAVTLLLFIKRHLTSYRLYRTYQTDSPHYEMTNLVFGYLLI